MSSHSIGRHHGRRFASRVHAARHHVQRTSRSRYSRFAAKRHRHFPLVQRLFGNTARSAASLTTGGVTRASEQTGNASFYRGGGRTAAGGRVGAATCAHRTLPFGTQVLVTNLRSGRQAVLTVNDRGPFVRGRIVDVSVGAAGRLGMIGSGTAPVRVQVLASRTLD